MRHRFAVASFTAALCVSNALAGDPCLDWSSGFDALDLTRGISGNEREGHCFEVAAFDDGNGPALYCAGRFTRAGAASAVGIARWSGTDWQALGSGLDLPSPNDQGYGLALTVFDDGTGPALFVAGGFPTAGGVTVSNIAKWDGAAWSALGSGVNSWVSSLVVFDDGNGAALYAAGAFDIAGGVSARGIAKWDGSSWSALGTGLGTRGFLNGLGFALATFDDGSGPALYVGGYFDSAGGVPASRIARWDGTTWSALGSGVASDPVYALAAFDDGSGPALYVGGDFTTAGGSPAQNLARWDGSAWSTAGDSNGEVRALGVHGASLYAGGYFNVIGGTPASAIARWDGAAWSAVGAGVTAAQPPSAFIANVYSIASIDLGGGSELYIGGRFDYSGPAALNNVTRFDGSQWQPLGTGGGVPRAVRELAAHDDGSSFTLYAAGDFRSAGMVAANRLARWDGTSWAPLGGGVPLPSGQITDVEALAVHDFGAGAVLMSAATFTDPPFRFGAVVAQWDGASWSQLGAAFNHSVRELVVYDDGSGAKLYAAGLFANDGLNHVARWSGSTWEPLGSGTDGSVLSMTVFDDGSGPALVVGGEFLLAGGVAVSGVARFDGAQWSALGSGISGQPVHHLAVFDAGSGAQLYGVVNGGLGSVSTVARWNGVSWSVVGTTASSQSINALEVFGDGTLDRAALYVGGTFTTIGGVAASRLARYDGTSWSEFGGGADDVVYALCAGNDHADAAPDLFVGGRFGSVGTAVSSCIAQWRGCEGPGEPFCFGDGSLATSCPCAAPDSVTIPSGAPFAGCASVTNAHGASFAAAGATNPDTVEFVVSGAAPTSFGMFFKGTADIPAGLAIADGVRCVGGSFVRFGAQSAVSGVARYPNPPLGFTLPISTVGSTPPGSGLTGYYQYVYRSALPGFCNAGTLNFTNAYRQQW
ncbi:MAG: hypothetical protein ACKVWV_08450 [Planctomycetota bacterium]